MGKKAPARSFTEEPEEGWFHDDEALKLKGVFYNFPVSLVGYVNVPVSLSSLPSEKRGDCCRAILKRLTDSAPDATIKKSKKTPKAWAKMLQGEAAWMDLPVNIGIAASGIVTTIDEKVVKPGPEGPAQLFFHNMNGISLATQGEADQADSICYLAKDDTGNRALYVFDGGDNAEELLATFGQAFLLAQRIAAAEARRRKEWTLKGKASSVAEYDMGSSAGGGGGGGAPQYDMGNAVRSATAEYDMAENIRPPNGGSSVRPTAEYDMAAGGGAPAPAAEYAMASAFSSSGRPPVAEYDMAASGGAGGASVGAGAEYAMASDVPAAGAPPPMAEYDMAENIRRRPDGRGGGGAVTGPPDPIGRPPVAEYDMAAAGSYEPPEYAMASAGVRYSVSKMTKEPEMGSEAIYDMASNQTARQPSAVPHQRQQEDASPLYDMASQIRPNLPHPRVGATAQNVMPRDAAAVRREGMARGGGSGDGAGAGAGGDVYAVVKKPAKKKMGWGRKSSSAAAASAPDNSPDSTPYPVASSSAAAPSAPPASASATEQRQEAIDEDIYAIPDMDVIVSKLNVRNVQRKSMRRSMRPGAKAAVAMPAAVKKPVKKGKRTSKSQVQTQPLAGPPKWVRLDVNNVKKITPAELIAMTRGK